MINSPVFPTPVGVFPGARFPWTGSTCLPHARGGVSDLAVYAHGEYASSPRPWGCF